MVFSSHTPFNPKWTKKWHKNPSFGQIVHAISYINNVLCPDFLQLSQIMTIFAL
jgi:hypothetical protein